MDRETTQHGCMRDQSTSDERELYRRSCRRSIDELRSGPLIGRQISGRPTHHLIQPTQKALQFAI